MGGIHAKSVGRPLDPWEDLLRVPASGVLSKIVTTLRKQSVGQATASVSTTSVTPGSNSLMLLQVVTATTGGAAAPSGVSGNGLTWVLVDDVALGNVRCTLYRAMGAAPTAGAVTVTYATAQGNVIIELLELTGVDATGTNGSGALLQSVNSSANSVSVSAGLRVAPTPGSVTMGFLAHNSTSADPTPGSGFSAVDAQVTLTSPSVKKWSEVNTAPTSQTVACTNPTAGNYGFIAVEVKAA